VSEYKILHDDQPHSIEIEGEMTIYTAMDVKNKLLAAYASSQSIEVDLSGVSEMDSAGLQLMLMAKEEAAAKYKTVRFKGFSQAVLSVLDVYDLTDYFVDASLLRLSSVSP